MRHYLGFQRSVESDDRLFVFFAGHGYTVSGKRGEVGYLIPVDGDPDDLSTLIRWDELTRNADLISSKHILYIMDACYGGLAVTRNIPQGSMRFLKDMLQRYSRQVLTAGKADEVVADSGGPRSGHSIFTGYLLDALEGDTMTSEGILSANGVMAYVYDKVATDEISNQTPHYGSIDVDGDFIIDASILEDREEEAEIDSDVLFVNPELKHTPELEKHESDIAGIVKEYLSDTKHLIRLEDLCNMEVRRFIERTSQEYLPIDKPEVTVEEFAERLQRYNVLIKNLQLLWLSCRNGVWMSI